MPEKWLCFYGSNQTFSWVLWLTSVEINGNAIGGFTWKQVEPGETIDSRCRALRGSNLIKLQFPFYIGMTKKVAIGILGAPTSVRKSEMFYMHEREQIIKGVRYTIENGIEVDSRNETVVQISAFEDSSD